jgi:prevent-host-death family protein
VSLYFFDISIKIIQTSPKLVYKGRKMETIGAYEAKTRLSQLLTRVSNGEKITITKHGVPIAILQSPEATQKIPTDQVITQLQEFRRSHRLKGISIREMINTGRC